MRIAHVLRRLSFDDWGGTEQVVWNLAKAQKAAGHEVRLFATTALWRGKGERGAGNGELEVVDGIEIARYKPIYPWWPMSNSLVDELDRKGGNPFVPGLGKALREWRPGVIHCHAMARIAELCLRTAQQIPTSNSQLPAKTVISLHGGSANIPEAEAASLKAPTRGLFPWGKIVDHLMRWTRRVPEEFEGIVCVGEDEYFKYSRIHPNVIYLPNGVDTSLFAPVPHSPFPVPHPSFTILCVARIDRQKNQMMIVEALARHPGMKARLVGPVTQPEYKDELERRALELGVADRVSFVGALPPGSEALVSEYANADVFVLPSRHEPFGIAVLEAWASGLPVIASDVGGLSRLCATHPDAAIVFPPGNAKALDDALSELGVGKASKKGREMSQAGLAAARNYDWNELGRRAVDFYDKI
ncbi:MAG: glycosyltransferase family 4 protein [Lentisphaerae bacterium]|nr:glycosyltransferase family 4 protein [Lentisphaerota bacterium]